MRRTTPRLRALYGNQTGSDFAVGSRGIVSASVWQKRRMPWAPWRTPIPEFFQPPIGSPRTL